MSLITLQSLVSRLHVNCSEKWTTRKIERRKKKVNNTTTKYINLLRKSGNLFTKRNAKTSTMKSLWQNDKIKTFKIYTERDMV